jgi:hypothetical protein
MPTKRKSKHQSRVRRRHTMQRRRKGGMHRAAMSAVKKVITSSIESMTKDPVKTGDKIKDIANAVKKGLEPTPTRATLHKGLTNHSTFSTNESRLSPICSSPKINDLCNSYRTPKKGTSTNVDVPAPVPTNVKRHRARNSQMYAPTAHDPTNIVKRDLFQDVS